MDRPARGPTSAASDCRVIDDRALSCSRVNLSWTADGEFTGWYVNFAEPPVPTPDGIESMDLVVDMFILPDGSWSWKDREDFDRGIDDGVLEPRLRPVFEAESQRVLAEYTTSQAAFDPAGSTGDRRGTSRQLSCRRHSAPARPPGEVARPPGPGLDDRGQPRRRHRRGHGCRHPPRS